MARESLSVTHPRLGRALEDRRFELSCIDGEGFGVGDEFCEILEVRRSPDVCKCGARVERVYREARLLVGCNKGYVTRTTHVRCHACGGGWSKHR